MRATFLPRRSSYRILGQLGLPPLCHRYPRARWRAVQRRGGADSGRCVSVPRSRHRPAPRRTAETEMDGCRLFDRGVLKIQRAISRQNGRGEEAPLKTKKRLSHPASVGRCDRRTKKSEVQSRRRVDIPITHWRPHVVGQRSAYAAKSPKTSGITSHTLSHTLQRWRSGTAWM